jgi:hypothetical protein
MKTYSPKSSVRKPMMYGGSTSKKMMGGGMANTMGNSMAMGMRKDKMNKNMAAMGMKHGGKAHYGKKK